VRDLLIGIVIGLAIAGGLYLYDKMRDPLPSVLAPVSPKVADAAKETKTCDKVQAYVPKVKKELGLPEHVQKDEQASVIAAAPVPPSDYPRTAITLLHRDTGVGEIYLQPEPTPWVAAVTRYNLGLYYGARTDADALVARLVASGEFLQLKRLNLGGTVSVDSDGQAFGGVGISIRF
jgi:hypothetical protein